MPPKRTVIHQSIALSGRVVTIKQGAVLPDDLLFGDAIVSWTTVGLKTGSVIAWVHNGARLCHIDVDGLAPIIVEQPTWELSLSDHINKQRYMELLRVYFLGAKSRKLELVHVNKKHVTYYEI